MGLRLTEGVPASAFAARTGRTLEEAVDPEILETAIGEGYLVWSGDRLQATLEGRLRLDPLLAALLR